MYNQLIVLFVVNSFVTRVHTFVQHRAKDGQVVLNSSAVPPSATELVLTLLYSQFDTFCYAGHDLDVVATETQLLGHQARNGAAQDGLGAQ